MQSDFTLTERQRQALKLLGGPQTHTMLRGGSRSGKTFLLTRVVAVRAIKAPESRHAIFRLRFNHIKTSLVMDTWPKMMRLCFPEVRYEINRTDWFAKLWNGSTVLFGGLDDKERTEKILGQEYATLYFNECSQIPFDSRNKAITRLAQKTILRPRALYDCNPPTVGHWTYQVFEQKRDPRSREPLAFPDDFASMMLNPADNIQNLTPEYLELLRSLPEREQARFLRGEFQTQVDNALWTYEVLDRRRIAPHELPDMRRICVAIDPSGCTGEEDLRSDEIGLVVCGVDNNNIGYVLEDASGRYAPEEWGKKALELLDKWMGDTIVAEINYGGAMVNGTIQAVRPGAPVKVVTASRGKVQRAEPVAALYELQRAFHAGVFPEMEEQMVNFSTAGYQGARSPDRADAAIWGLTELVISNEDGPWHNAGKLAS